MATIASVLNLDRHDLTSLRITDPYSIHRVVYSLFEDTRSEAEKNAGKSSGILFADLGGDHLSRRILLLSNRQPASAVEGQYGVVKSKTLSDEFLEHEFYNFSVIVNPTRHSAETRKREPIKGREKISDWFLERSSQWGFTVSTESLRVNKVEVMSFSNKAKHTVTLAKAHIQGQLTVIDREAFRKSFKSGIGRGRAFGCGLLQIVPVIENPFS